MVFNVGEVLEAAVNSLKAFKVYLIEKQTYADKLIAHLQRLNPDDRRMRFGISLPDERIPHYINESIRIGDYTFAVFDEAGEIIAFLHMAKDARDPTAYELGLSVDADHRKAGYGNALFSKAVAFAKTLGAKRVYTYCLGENKAMQNMARKNSMRVMLAHGDSTGELILADRNNFEIAKDLIDFATTEQMMLFDRSSKDMVNSFLAQAEAFSKMAKSFRQALIPIPYQNLDK